MNTIDENNNAIETAIKLGKSIGDIKTINGVPVVIKPEGYEIEVFPELEKPLMRIEEFRTLQTLDSFIDYVNEYRNDSTVLFISDINQSITAQFDYHKKLEPNHCLFSAFYICPKSDEWNEWNKANKTKMTQFEFATFLENNIDDIVEPSGSEMLSCALALESTKKADFSSSIRLNNGEVQLKYEEEIAGSVKNNAISIPEEFSIGIPVFKNGDPYKIKCRLRYRINNADLTLWFEMIKPQKVLDDAFEHVKEIIDNELTEVPSYI